VLTYVVRIWVPAEPDGEEGRLGLHGTVEEVGSRRTATFGDGEELLAFLAGVPVAEVADE
jgi:hypothetical protein